MLKDVPLTISEATHPFESPAVARSVGYNSKEGYRQGDDRNGADCQSQAFQLRGINRLGQQVKRPHIVLGQGIDAEEAQEPLVQ